MCSRGFIFLLLILNAIPGTVSVIDRGTPGRIPHSFFRVILTGLASLIESIPRGQVEPQVFSKTVVVNNQQCLIRLSFYSAICEGSPDILPGAAVYTGFRGLVDTVYSALLESAASYVTVIEGRFGVEYMLDETHQELTSVSEIDSTSIAAWPTCISNANMIQSGPKGHPFSTIRPGWLLKSMNELYTLELGYNCDLKIRNKRDYSVVWTPRANSGNKNCYLAAQLDGNVVLENDKVCVWATNTMTGGLVSSKLVMQNDRNLVLYKDQAIWASNTAN